MIQLSNLDIFPTIQRPATGQAGQQSQECQAQALSVTCNLMLRNLLFFLQRKSRDIQEAD